jgi:hypothetical protein
VTVNVNKTESDTEIEPAPEQKPAAKRPQRVQKPDDDDEFKGDAPSAAKKPERATAHAPASQAAHGNVRVLKPFRQRAEAMEIMDSRSAMLSSFFKRAKWYTDEDGNIILKFAAKFEIDNMKMFDGEPFFVKIISEVTGRSFTLANMKCECEAEKKGDEVIDKIIEAAENA